MADEGGPNGASYPHSPAEPAPSRRGVLLGAGGGWAALQLGLVSANAATAETGTAQAASPLFVYDLSIEGTPHAARMAADAGARLAPFRDDVGDAWLNVIQPLWRDVAVPVLGLTHGGAFFCLEHLARSHRLTCIWRSPLPGGQSAGAATRALLGLSRTASPARSTPLAAAAAIFPAAPILWLLQPVTARATA